MQTFLATFAVFLIAAAAMAVGVVFSNRRLRGSCGGTRPDCSCTLAEQSGCPRRKSPAT